MSGRLDSLVVLVGDTLLSFGVFIIFLFFFSFLSNARTSPVNVCVVWKLFWWFNHRCLFVSQGFSDRGNRWRNDVCVRRIRHLFVSWLHGGATGRRCQRRGERRWVIAPLTLHPLAIASDCDFVTNLHSSWRAELQRRIQYPYYNIVWKCRCICMGGAYPRDNIAWKCRCVWRGGAYPHDDLV